MIDGGADFVIIGGQIHRVKVFFQNLTGVGVQWLRNLFLLSYQGLIDLGFSPQIVRNMLICGLYHAATVLERYLLSRNQRAYHSSNIDFTPAVRNCREPTLDVAHRGRKHLHSLKIKILCHFIYGIGVVYSYATAHRDLLIGIRKNLEKLHIIVEVFLDISQLGINAFYEAGK